MMKNKTIVLNYGCPRTGTTFINQMLSNGLDFITGKIAEGHASHPIRSTCGLLNLSYTFQKYNLVFVRTIRDPISIFESFYHAKEKNLAVLGDQDYLSIKKMIELEEVNTQNQSKENIKIITINFDKLEDIDYAKQKVGSICSEINSENNTKIFLEFIEKKYNKIPIRQGRLSDNCRMIKYLTTEQEKDINQWYQTIGNLK